MPLTWQARAVGELRKTRLIPQQARERQAQAQQARVPAARQAQPREPLWAPPRPLLRRRPLRWECLPHGQQRHSRTLQEGRPRMRLA